MENVTRSDERAENVVASFVMTFLLAAVVGFLVYVGAILDTRTMLGAYCVGLFCTLWRTFYLVLLSRTTQPKVDNE